jgi:hypothetical protein
MHSGIRQRCPGLPQPPTLHKSQLAVGGTQSLQLLCKTLHNFRISQKPLSEMCTTNVIMVFSRHDFGLRLMWQEYGSQGPLIHSRHSNDSLQMWQHLQKWQNGAIWIGRTLGSIHSLRLTQMLRSWGISEAQQEEYSSPRSWNWPMGEEREEERVWYHVVALASYIIVDCSPRHRPFKHERYKEKTELNWNRDRKIARELWGYAYYPGVIRRKLKASFPVCISIFY